MLLSILTHYVLLVGLTELQTRRHQNEIPVCCYSFNALSIVLMAPLMPKRSPLAATPCPRRISTFKNPSRSSTSATDG